MSDGGLDAMMGIIPLAVGAGVVMAVTDQMLGDRDRPRSRKKKRSGIMDMNPYGSRRSRNTGSERGFLDRSRRISRGGTPGGRPMVTERFRNPSKSKTGLETSPIFQAGARMGRDYRGIGKGFSSRDLKYKFAHP